MNAEEARELEEQLEKAEELEAAAVLETPEELADAAAEETAEAIKAENEADEEQAEAEAAEDTPAEAEEQAEAEAADAIAAEETAEAIEAQAEASNPVADVREILHAIVGHLEDMAERLSRIENGPTFIDAGGVIREGEPAEGEEIERLGNKAEDEDELTEEQLLTLEGVNLL